MTPDGEAAHRFANAATSASHDMPAAATGEGSSGWRSSPLRAANMFEGTGQYSTADGGRYASTPLLESRPASEDEGQAADDGERVKSSGKAAGGSTRVAKACVPCSTKKRRCDGGECSVH